MKSSQECEFKFTQEKQQLIEVVHFGVNDKFACEHINILKVCFVCMSGQVSGTE